MNPSLQSSASASTAHLAMKVWKRDSFLLPANLQPQQQHSGGSSSSSKSSSSSNGRFPQNGSVGRKAQPLVGGWKRARRCSCGQRRKRTEEYGSRFVSCNGRRRGVLLLQWNSQRQRQEEVWETEHQRAAALHPDCWGQGEGRRLPGIDDDNTKAAGL